MTKLCLSFVKSVQPAREWSLETVESETPFLGRGTQNPPTFGSWGFDSPSRHQSQPALVCTFLTQRNGREISDPFEPDCYFGKI
jgi:hypothetical protein